MGEKKERCAKEMPDSGRPGRFQKSIVKLDPKSLPTGKGWDISRAMACIRGKWRIVEIANVYQQ